MKNVHLFNTLKMPKTVKMSLRVKIIVFKQKFKKKNNSFNQTKFLANSSANGNTSVHIQRQTQTVFTDFVYR